MRALDQINKTDPEVPLLVQRHRFENRFSVTFFAEKVILVTLGAEKFVDSFWEAHGTIFGGFLQLLQGRCAPLRLQNGAFGVCGPRDGGVGQCLAQSAVPEQRIVEDPVHPVSQRCDRGVLSVVGARDGRGGGGGRGQGGGLAPQHTGRVFSLV